MPIDPSWRCRALAFLVVAGMLAACGDDGDATADTPSTTAPPAETVDREADVEAYCDHFAEQFAAIPFPTSGSAAEVDAYVAARAASADDAPVLDVDALPDEVRGEHGDLAANQAAADERYAEASDLAAAGDAEGALRMLEYGDKTVAHTAGMAAVGGAKCFTATPEGAAAGSLNVPVVGGWQLAAAFDSIWVSRQLSPEVVRIDPESGAVIASIDVGARPAKLQAADGRLIVRTDDAYLAVDPATDQVVATLAKADVGPAANRSWAVDGALWICDGQSLHRYEPTTFEAVTSLELGFDCGQVYATEELVIAWSYNEDDGESGTSVAAFVDPAADEVLATVSLPVDVGVPTVLDDEVVLPGYGGPTAAVVDRATWTVSGTHDLGRATGGSQGAYDGTSLYLGAHDKEAILVVDPTTMTVIDEILPLFGVNSLDFDGERLWTVSSTYGFLQRLA